MSTAITLTSIRWSRLLLAGVAGFLAVLTVAAAPGGYENSTVLSAAEIVAPALRSGPHYKIEDRVTNDGYLNTYTIVSTFGTFEARGEDLLRERIQEVGALAELAEVTKSDAFKKAFAEAAVRPVETAINVVKNPVETAKGLPSGVNRFFKRTVRNVKKTAKHIDEKLDEDKEAEAGNAPPQGDPGAGQSQTDKAQQAATDVTKSYLGVNRSKREWAQKLGVDPYSSNEVLQKELDRVASAASVASFGVRKLTPSIDVVDYLADANDMVWTMSATDLEVINLKRLEQMGVGKERREELLANTAYSPSRLTGLVAALHAIEMATGRAELVERAAIAESEEEAFFFQRSAELLRIYHSEEKRIRAIAVGEVWGGGITADGTLVMPLAVDHLTWSEDFATLIPAAGDHYRDHYGVERIELVLAGTASVRARKELGASGWQVQEGARARWLDR